MFGHQVDNSPEIWTNQSILKNPTTPGLRLANSPDLGDDEGDPASVSGQFDDADQDKRTYKINTSGDVADALFNRNLHGESAHDGGGDNSEEDYDLEDDDDGYEMYGDKVIGPNSQTNNLKSAPEEVLKKFAYRISLDKYEGADLEPEAATRLISTQKKMSASRQKHKDKRDRATVEQVMDPRTRMILYKLMSNEKLASIDGCISTGKEANVYHATAPALNPDKPPDSLAIKVYKTSILTFKARDKYVEGEFRFRGGYSKRNPRKMVALWAEKEYRNLLRIHASGSILVPRPMILKSHVLVMSFIGSQGWPAPLLKDVRFDEALPQEVKESLQSQAPPPQLDSTEDEDELLMHKLLSKLYRDTLLILYRLYKHCKLVHADFSEFNLILKDWLDLYVIDVSQSVEHDHPRSLDFLRSDLKNVQDFFGKRHVLLGDYKSLFDWITSPTIGDGSYEQVLGDILVKGMPLTEKEEDASAAVEEEVFRQTFIPKKMTEIVHAERDIKRAKAGQELVYTNMLGMKADLSGPQPHEKPELEAEAGTSDSESSGSSSSESDSEGEGEGGSKFKNSARPLAETAEEKKNRKKLVKESKAEKRETKMKKHVKKRKEKLSHANAKRK